MSIKTIQQFQINVNPYSLKTKKKLKRASFKDDYFSSRLRRPKYVTKPPRPTTDNNATITV